METDLAVLVVGAGPTGLLLAAELTRRGVRTRLIDLNPDPLHWDRATIVHPRSLEVFESLGIVEPLLAVGVKQRRARIFSEGRELGAIDLSLCGSRHGFNLGVSEEVTESVLTDYLQRLGGEIVRSSRLVGLEQDVDRVVATIDQAGQTETVSAQWLVGCDGLRSAARSLSGIGLSGDDHVELWAVFDATLPNWSDSFEVTYGYLDPPTVILTSLPEQRWRIYLRPTSDDSDLIADATRTLTRYLPQLVLENVTHATRFHCHSKLVDRYRAGRVLVAGDAAHVCSPSQGHGMNSGLQEAFNLAWKLALVCQGHAAPALLDSYEAERRPVAEKIISSGEEIGKAQELTDPAARRARDEQIRAVFASSAGRHHESVAEAELDIDYCRSPIVMGDPNEILASGHRLSDTIEVVQPTGARQRLHELAHRAAHTALIIGGPESTAESLTDLAVAVRTEAPEHLVEQVFTLTAHSATPSSRDASLFHCPTADRDLGVTNLALFLVRPDDHIGLRADRDHVAALAAYEKQLTVGKV